MTLKEFKNKFNDKYYIPYSALQNAGESNRISSLVVSTLLILSDIVNFLLIFIFNHSNLADHKNYLVYLCIYTPINIYTFIHARHAKNSGYTRKSISAYLIVFVWLGASVFNLYFINSPHNGFVVFYLAGFLSLIFFSLSPLYYCFEVIITAIILVPGVYENFGFLSVVDLFVATIIMVCLSLYRRRKEKQFILLMKKQKKSLEAKTFGNFTLLYDDKVIKFSRSKSSEFLAYLIYKNGSSVKTKEMVSVLYGEHADSERYGSSLRNLVVDIKNSLSELEIQNFFVKEYNNFRINPEAIKCDYYDFLAGDPKAVKSFAGEFMSQYSWAEEAIGFLEKKTLQG